MKYHRNKKSKTFIKFLPGELIEITTAGCYTVWDMWAHENGYAIPPVRNISAKTLGKFVKTSPTGPMYKIVDINGELFEVIHVNIRKAS